VGDWIADTFESKLDQDELASKLRDFVHRKWTFFDFLIYTVNSRLQILYGQLLGQFYWVIKFFFIQHIKILLL
jgi:hypothetical protein